MKIWKYRIWFDRDTNEVGISEYEGTIIKERTVGTSANYMVELTKPVCDKMWFDSKEFNSKEPRTSHVPGDDENMSSEGTDYYFMGFTYSEDEPLSAVVTRKRQCMSMCNKEVIKTLEERKAEIEKAISRLEYLNRFGGNEDA